MVTFRIILTGILSFVPNKPWSESPSTVWVLSHSGKPSGACSGQPAHGHEKPPEHHTILLFDPADLDSTQPQPRSTFRLAQRRCPKSEKEPFLPLREVLIAEDLDLRVVVSQPTGNVRQPNKPLQIFEGGAKASGAASPTLEDKNRFSRVVALDELVEKLAIDASCLVAPLDPKGSCRPALGARLTLESGMVYASKESRTWRFQAAPSTAPGGKASVKGPERELTVAAVAELQLPEGSSLTLCGRKLEAKALGTCNTPDPACGCDDVVLSLKPGKGKTEVVLTLDNSPLSSLLSAKLCPKAPEKGPPHADLIYDFAATCVPADQRPLPKPVNPSSTGGGEHDHNPEQCNPVNRYPPPPPSGGPG